MNIPQKKKVFILGSCVTRDIFDENAFEQFELVGYVARSSLSCSMESNLLPVENVEVDKIGSDFQKRMVEIDISHELPEILEEKHFDFLLYDAIDERFDTYIELDKRCCTVSNELISTGFNPKSRHGRLVHFGSDEHFSRWKCGWDKLIATLQNRGQLDRLIINKVYWSEACIDGSDFLPTYTKEKIGAANIALTRLYKHIEKTLPKQQIIEYNQDAFVADPTHRWGRSPFHFTTLAKHTLRQLILITAARESHILITHTDGRFNIELSINTALLQDRPSHELLNKTEYAFYLLRNRKKVGVQWYSSSKTANFKGDGRGKYQVLAFIRFDGDPCRTITTSSIVVSSNTGPTYDLSYWGVEVKSVPFKNLWGSQLHDGLFHVSNIGCQLDFLLTGEKYLKQRKHALVTFCGALSQRGDLPSPLFQGGGLSSELEACVLAIADPAISSCDTLKLGWYLGKQGCCDLTVKIANALDDFSRKYCIDLLLVGGSGGGFAALNVLSFMKMKNVKALVWGPQTCIADYLLDEVKDYLIKSFNLMIDSRQDAIRLFEELGLPYDLKQRASFLSGRQVLFLQNHSDWHTEIHASPLLRQLGIDIPPSIGYVTNGLGFTYLCGTWGKGHTVPPRDLIAKGVLEMSHGKDSISTGRKLFLQNIGGAFNSFEQNRISNRNF